MKNCKTKVLILFSGGIDSTACINYYLDLEFEICALFVDYGQRSKQKELNSVKNIAAYYGINFQSLHILNHVTYTPGEIRGRNAFLIMAALLSNPYNSGLISIGIHGDVPYYDCSEDFLKKINVIVKDSSNGQITVDAPFIDWDKKMIFSYCKEKRVPINLTYSCENGDEPCGKCLSCLDRSALNVS